MLVRLFVRICRGSAITQIGHTTTILLQRIHKYKLGGNDSGSLEVHSSPVIIINVFDLCHIRVDVSRELGEEPLEVGEERWIVKRPLRGVLCDTFRTTSYQIGYPNRWNGNLVVPLLQR